MNGANMYVWHTVVGRNWVEYTMKDGVEIGRRVLSDDQARAKRLPVVGSVR
jgi:hypothetical protein